MFLANISWLDTAIEIATTLSLVLGVSIAWIYGAHAQGREQILDAQEAIKNSVEFVLASGIEGDLPEIVSQDMYFRRPFLVGKRSRRDITVVKIDDNTQKVGVSLVFSSQKLRSGAVEQALQSISAKIVLGEETKAILDRVFNETGRYRFSTDFGNAQILIFVLDKRQKKNSKKRRK